MTEKPRSKVIYTFYDSLFQLSAIYTNSLLGESFDRVEIEAFSKGSIVVDYYVHFKDFSEPVSTTDLKLVLNQELQGFRPNGSADGVAALGRFQVDPNYTDFIGKLVFTLQQLQWSTDLVEKLVTAKFSTKSKFSNFAFISFFSCME